MSIKKHWSLLFPLFLLLISPELLAQEKPTLFKNVQLFQDGTWQDKELLIQDGRIQRIEDEIPEAEAERTIDGKGRYLLPPVVNAHVHLWRPGELQKALAHGIFALLDMHSSDEMAQRMRAYNDSLRYASYYSSNAGATVPNGHGTQFGIEVPTIDSTTDPESFVMDRIEAGADYIKILREPMMPTLDFEQTKRIIEVAHREDFRVIAHVSRKDDAVKLVEQGVDGLAHIWYDEPIAEEELARIADRKIFVIPTLLVIQKVKEHMEGRSEGETEAMSFQKVQEEVGRLHEAGVPILAGTDPPNAKINYNDDLFAEMRLLHEAGLSVEEVLKSATENVHSNFWLLPYGLGPEKNASFLMLEEKPTSAFKISKKLVRIYKEGEALDPDDLLEKASQDGIGQGEHTLKVEVEGIRSNDGQVLLQLQNAEQKNLASRKGGIDGKSCTFHLKGLKNGSYAVDLLHDENGNGRFDQDENYIPKEGWGYSNNAEAAMGRPDHSEKLVKVKADTTIRIEMKYYGE